MAENSTYTPPKVWQWNENNGGRFRKSGSSNDTAQVISIRRPARAVSTAA